MAPVHADQQVVEPLFRPILEPSRDPLGVIVIITNLEALRAALFCFSVRRISLDVEDLLEQLGLHLLDA